MTAAPSPHTSGPDRPSLARDSGRAVAGAVVSNACNVLVILVLARFLGGEQVGEYTIAFALRAILLLVCGLGMRVALTRFVAAHMARGESDAVRGVIHAGIVVPVGLATVVGALGVLTAGPMAHDVFGDADLVAPLRLFALSLPFLAVMDLSLAATQGFQTMRAYVLVGQVLEPVTRLLLTFAVVVAGFGIDATAYALLASSVLSAVAAAAALLRQLGHLPGTTSRVPWRELVGFGGTSWVASMATQGLLWADVVILGVLVSTADVGAYQVAARVVLIGTLVITPLTAAMAPRVAYLWARDDRAGVTDRYSGVVLWTTRLSLPALAGVVAVPAAVLEVFGDGFSHATGVVLLLSAGAAAEAVGAPSAVLLNQIGRNRLNMVVNVSQLALNVGLNLALVPLWGINGAAVAWAATLVVGAVVRVVAVRHAATSRWPFSRRLAVAVLAAVLASTAAAVLARRVPDVALLQLLVAGTAVVVVYLGVVLRAGLSGDERNSLSREVTLRAPWLRRWRVQRALPRAGRAGFGGEPLALDQLISPFRLDVVARAELYRLAREHASLRSDDPAAFLALVRSSRYRAWFEEVLVPRRHVSSDPARAERQFDQIVTASLQLHDRHAARGAAALGRVSVALVPAGTDLGGWSLPHDRWVLLDGGHRVALALLDGATTLEPDQYVVVTDGLPPNNTAVLASSGAFETTEVVTFLARGLTPAAEPAPRTWEDLLAGLDEDDRAAVAAWPESAATVSPR